MKKELTTNIDRYELGYLKALAEVEKMILEHKDCKEYHRIDGEHKYTFYRISCLEFVLRELQRLKEKNESKMLF